MDTGIRSCLVLALLAAISTALTAGQDPAPAAGAALFQRSCASCHNVEGRAPSLSTGVFSHGGDAAQIAQTIRAGVPGTQMPAFPRLTDNQIWQVVTYIRSLTPTAVAPASAPPKPAVPASYCRTGVARRLRGTRYISKRSARRQEGRGGDGRRASRAQLRDRQ
jgi:cytochrome c553